MGSLGLSTVFFCFFIRLTETGRTTASVKATINRDLSTDAVAETVSVKAFCLPRLSFL
jgi:hypothetical protein